MDRSRMDCYFGGGRLAKPAAKALSAPAGLQLPASGSATLSDDDATVNADGTQAPASTAYREQSCNALADDSQGDPVDDEPAGESTRMDRACTPPGLGCTPGAAAPSEQPRLQPAMRAVRSSSLSSGDCPLIEPQRSQSQAAGDPIGVPPDSAASTASKAAGLVSAEVKREADEGPLLGDVESPEPAGKWSAGVKREADDGPLLGDVDLREQAVLMALFEDRRRSSRDAAVAAALAKAGRTPSQQDGAAGQSDRRQLGRSVSAPAAADVDAESAAKRQRTLRGFFQVLQRG